MSVNEAAIDLSTRGTLPASWGWSEPLDLAPTHELRRLVVSPYAAIDALCRTDQDVHWVIVCGEATVVLGTYGTQGDFSWQRSSITALPEAHVGLERWGEHCPGIYHRSVFVDWRDYDGNYGFEQVNY